jgi:DNA primase
VTRGDISDLFMAVEGGELWEAVITLSERYGIDLPQHKPEWFSWQDEKGRRRKMLREIRAAHYQRHLFHLFKEDLQAIEDPDFREEEARKIWDALGLISWRFAHEAG